MLTIAKRVQNGIDWLNKNGPKDWPNTIKLINFDIKRPCRCVLGNVFRINESGLNGFDFAFCDLMYASQCRLEDCGFDAYDQPLGHDFEENYEEEYQQLQAEWTRRLTEIKNATDCDQMVETTCPASICHMDRRTSNQAVLLRS